MNEHIEQWQERAQAAAEEFERHACKRAVQEVTPTDREARELYELYSQHESDIEKWCETALAKAQGEDAPPASLEDLVSESFILFQRSLVRYNPEEASLRTFLQHDLRGRIRDYLTAISEQSRPRSESKRRDRGAIAPGFDVPSIYSELVEEGRVSRAAERLWRRASPSGE